MLPESLKAVMNFPVSEATGYYDRFSQEFPEYTYEDRPVCRKEVGLLKEQVLGFGSEKRVLEIACGTGFRTAVLEVKAKRVIATDLSEPMLDAARKRVTSRKVSFVQADAYCLSKLPGEFDAGLGNFWFSHIPKAKIAPFLGSFHARLGKGSSVFFADNNAAGDYGGQISHDPVTGDAYRTRSLSDGSQHKVIKNYFDEAALRKIFEPLSVDFQVFVGTCFWRVRYRIR